MFTKWSASESSLVEGAPRGVSEHDVLDFPAALDHVGPELRLDGLREIDAGDEEFVVVRDDGKTEPVADAIHNGFAAIERDLELVAAIVEDDAFAGGIDVAD